jgi:hypothetical protein
MWYDLPWARVGVLYELVGVARRVRRNHIAWERSCTMEKGSIKTPGRGGGPRSLMVEWLFVWKDDAAKARTTTYRHIT